MSPLDQVLVPGSDGHLRCWWGVGDEEYGLDRLTRICKLRSKIDKNFDIPLLHTVRGAGYVLREY